MIDSVSSFNPDDFERPRRSASHSPGSRSGLADLFDMPQSSGQGDEAPVETRRDDRKFSKPFDQRDQSLTISAPVFSLFAKFLLTEVSVVPPDLSAMDAPTEVVPDNASMMDFLAESPTQTPSGDAMAAFDPAITNGTTDALSVAGPAPEQAIEVKNRPADQRNEMGTIVTVQDLNFGLDPRAVATSNGQILLAQIHSARGGMLPFPSATDQERPSMPKPLAKIASVINDEPSATTDSLYDLQPDQQVVAQVKTGTSGTHEQGLNGTDSDGPQIAKATDAVEGSQHVFSNLLNAVSKDQKIDASILKADPVRNKVFEQIEPAIFRLASLSRTGGEKNILKIRLNPAELGAVEITLVKRSNGEINAHFQTNSERTRQILNDGFAQLRYSLEQTGWQVGDLDISSSPFSANGNEGREDRSQQFGRSEERSVSNISSDGDLQNEDDPQDRLVNLRA